MFLYSPPGEEARAFTCSCTAFGASGVAFDVYERTHRARGDRRRTYEANMKGPLTRLTKTPAA